MEETTIDVGGQRVQVTVEDGEANAEVLPQSPIEELASEFEDLEGVEVFGGRDPEGTLRLHVHDNLARVLAAIDTRDREDTDVCLTTGHSGPSKGAINITRLEPSGAKGSDDLFVAMENANPEEYVENEGEEQTELEELFG